MKRTVLVCLTAIALSACATQQYSCPLPEEAGKCMSISDAHEQLKSKNKGKASSATGTQSPSYSRPQAKNASQYKPGNPIWRDARRLRIWFTPHVDKKNNWHDQSYVVVLVDKGEWLVYENRQELLRKNQFMNLSSPYQKNGNDSSVQKRPDTLDAPIPSATDHSTIDENAQDFVDQIAQPKGK